MKFYLCDFDGTLVDSMPAWAEKMFRILAEEGIAPPKDFIKTITPLGDVGIAEFFIELGSRHTKDELMQKMHDYSVDAYCNTIVLKDGVYDFVKRQDKSDTCLAVLTASPHVFLDPCLKRCGVFDDFDFLWTVDDFADLRKNNTQIYVEAASRMGCSVEEIIFVDDNAIALKTAKKAGCKTVGVFDITSEDSAEEIKATVDKYVMSFKEL